MATKYVRLGADAGGDGTTNTDSSGDNTHAYNSLAAAFDALDSPTALTEQLTLEITVGGRETLASDIDLGDVQTNDPLYYLEIKCTGAAHHGGVSRENGGTGYQLYRASGNCLRATTTGNAYYRLKGLEVLSAGTGSGDEVWYDVQDSGVSTSDKRAEECIFALSDTSSASYTINLRAVHTISLINCLSLNNSYRAAELREATGTIDHCGFVAPVYGAMVNTNLTITNSYALDGTSEDWYDEANASSSHCASTDGSAPNTSEVTITTPSDEFVTYSDDIAVADLNLQSDANSNLDGAGTGSRTNDITGSARTGSPDIGPYNYASGGSIIPQAMHHYRNNSGSGL